MKERPMLMSAPMVRAIQAGTKTQTRRVVKPQPHHERRFVGDGLVLHKKHRDTTTSIHSPLIAAHCPYGEPGDRLWVKETFRAWGRWETRYSAKKGRDEWHFIDMTLECGKQYRYTADAVGDNGPRQRGSVTPQWWKRPAIFMPRVASRILLDITGERVERLNDISEAGARSEGIELDIVDMAVMARDYLTGGWFQDWAPAAKDYMHTDRICSGSYRTLWESINGPESWAENPFVWVIEFKRVQA